MGEVIIVGGGIAGLAAAECLAKRGVAVTLLEGQERLGGRINTICSRIGNLPIELGAEFIHGAKNALWEVIRATGLETQEVPGRHWRSSGGGLKEDNQSWEELERVFSAIDQDKPDRDFNSFLDRADGIGEQAKAFALEYVEGFHAADPSRVSIHSLARAEAASEADEGDRQFRISQGYGALLEWLENQVRQHGVEVRFGTIVDSIKWHRHRVEVAARNRAGREHFRAPQALVTVPLGVLQAQGLGGLVFDPRIPGKERAIQALAMGAVVKVTFQFRARFWPVENFGFIHAGGALFPTWWSDERGLLLTGWVGGPRAEKLARRSSEEIKAKAIGVMAEIFRTNARGIEDLIIGVSHHDWIADPFSRGAYSYTPVGSTGMIAQLAAPVDDTLFFAGEATDRQGEQGTVHAALASGRRAAAEILQTMPKPAEDCV